ncbi:Sex-lethal [Orchesella cincta]|uniref:Sex-lethal n=1 Tax=Orchesella cincta TaxID=48709 RepID=A0A1D2NGG9_ORCCI|nr:Sex-lethal [Orchesella cincta]
MSSTAEEYLKGTKTNELAITGKLGAGDTMSSMKAGKEVDATSTSGSGGSSGIWSTNAPDSSFYIDRGGPMSLGIGDGDKASFPLLTSSGDGSHSLDSSGKRDQDLDMDGRPTVSVSQAGRKYIITKRNLIVNYLPQSFTDRQLFNLFVSYGAIDSVKIMRDATTGYSYGFGFVNFVNEEDGIRARAEMNGAQVENKRIKVSFARPPSDDIKDTNLYVTNLPRSMTEEHLFTLFAPFGEIVQRKLLVDRYTNLPRGVAFIRFERRDQAAAAINALNNYVPEGAEEPIRIRLAEDHGKQKAAYLAGFRAGMGLPSAALYSEGTWNNSQ